MTKYPHRNGNPRPVYCTYLTGTGRTRRVIRLTRASSLVRGVQAAVKHMLEGDYGNLSKVHLALGGQEIVIRPLRGNTYQITVL